jgi:hypothetical protein
VNKKGLKNKVICFDPKKRRMVLAGEVIGSTFHRNVKPEHFMNVCQGYGLQETVMGQLQADGITSVVLHHSLGYTLKSKLEDWLEPDILVADYGNGKQRFLPVNRMTRSTKGDV